MKIFVTGGTGFVGAHFINAAHRAGYEVLACRRDSSSRPRTALDREPAWLTKPIERIARRDLKGCGAIVHLASAGVSPQSSSWAELNRCNVFGQLHLCEAALRASVRRLVLVGSISEYGNAARRYEFIPPDSALEPTFPYAASKAAGFMLAHGLAVASQCEFYYGRISAAYGEGQYPGNIWPALRAAALSGADFEMTPGAQVRDFISVNKAAEVLVHAVSRPDVKAGTPLVENVGSGVPVVLREWALELWSKWKAKGRLMIGALPYRDNEIMRYVPLVPSWAGLKRERTERPSKPRTNRSS